MKRIPSFLSSTFGQIFILGATIFLLGFLPINNLKGQGCAAIEREFQSYFMDYQMGGELDIRYLDKVYAKCPRPTQKLDLIYFFLKATDAYYNERLSDHEAYEDATYYYDLSAKNFDYLTRPTRSDNKLAEKFFANADEFEFFLQQQADRLAYERENRYYGENQEEPNWVKKGPKGIEMIEPETRGQKKEKEEDRFEKKYYQNGQYVDLEPVKEPNPFRDGATADTEDGESYGSLGTVSEVNPINYLKWIRKWKKETPFVNDSDLLEESLESQDYTASICMFDRLPLRPEPGERSEIVDLVEFGEVVARMDKEPAVNKDGKSYVIVRTESGRIGWVEKGALIRDGVLAVITQNTRGFLQTNVRADRNAILFNSAELVVLEGNQGEWIRVVTRNGIKEGWLRGISHLSIDDFDIDIALMIYDAMLQPNSKLRRSKLEKIRQVEGFYESELASEVLQLIEESYTYNGK